MQEFSTFNFHRNSKMSHKIYLINMMWAFIIWIYQEQLVYNFPEYTTVKQTINVTPEGTTFSEVPFLNKSNDTNWTVHAFSYTERFLMRRVGRQINVKQLMLEYSTVCPIQQHCDDNLYFEEKYLFDGYTRDIPAFSDCKNCYCGRSCVELGDCCPGTHFGYVNHNECINRFLYPTEKIEAYYMVGTCLHNYMENRTLNELCESEIRPCTSIQSGIIYKNQYCAQCNRETDCIYWRLDVKCIYDEMFRESLNSLIDMKTALNQSKCSVQYKYTTSTDIFLPCNENDYLKEVRINRCNVTGLWLKFNADIAWACQNFIVPYKEFRNVYCYICNPSHANAQTTPLIDTCETDENTSDLFNLSIACKNFPASDRFMPFKNIYCYACNHGHNLSKSSGTEVSYLRDISEINDQVNLSSQMYLSLVFPYKTNVEDVDRFVRDSIQDTFEVMEMKSHGVNRINYSASTIDQIINHYITVCGKQNLCIYGNNTVTEYGNPVCGHCTCESDCGENEECCIDIVVSKQPYSCLESEIFPIFTKHNTQTLGNRNEWTSRNETYMVIDTCLNQPHELSYNCSSVEGSSDFFANIPISTHGTIAYRNIYCYACNNNYIKDIILDIQAYCDTYIEHELFTNLAQLLQAVKLYCHTVAFVPVKSKTCIEKYNALNASFVGGEYYKRIEEHPSNFEFREEIFINVWQKNLTNPVKDVYSSCNITGNQKESDVLINDICENDSVTLLSLPEYRVENKVYKNFACFLCNPNVRIVDIDPDEVISDCRLNSSVEWYERNEKLEELCIATQRYDAWFPYKNMYCSECNLPPWQLIDEIVLVFDQGSPAIYKYIFSISPEDFAQMYAASEDTVPECPEGTYDYNLNECRSLYCNKGYQLYNSTCKSILKTASYHLYDISLNLSVRELDGFKGNTGDSVKIDLAKLCSYITEIITNSFGETADFYIQKWKCEALSPCINFQSANFSKSEFLDIAQTKFINLFFVIFIEYTETIMAVQTALVTALNRRYYLKDLYDIDENSHSIVLDATENQKLGLLDIGHYCAVQFTQFKEIYGTDIVLSHYEVDKFLLCAYVKLNFSEVNMYLDTVILPVKDKRIAFPGSEYKVIDNDTIIICIDDFNKKTKNMFDEKLMLRSKYETLNMFTLICTVISLTCLFVTFITYCLFSELRNVPGKNLMLLCFSLFASQAFLQFGLNGENKSTLCSITGVCIHYFWMAFFCAMNICSFHIYKIFCSNDMSNNLFRNDRSLFIKYLLYFLFFPLALVLITVLTNVIKSDASFIGYGVNYCFISDFYILVGTFLTPASIIFLNNFIFFSLAFHKIRSSSNVRSTRDKNNFFIFLKLCTIVGVTWPLLIIDNILNVSWFSFMVSGINSLQGMFVFGSFVLNKRVILLYKAALLKIEDKESVTADVRNTTS